MRSVKSLHGFMTTRKKPEEWGKRPAHEFPHYLNRIIGTDLRTGSRRYGRNQILRKGVSLEAHKTGSPPVARWFARRIDSGSDGIPCWFPCDKGRTSWRGYVFRTQRIPDHLFALAGATESRLDQSEEFLYQE